VLLHGIIGSPERTWKRLPNLIREAVKPEISFDILSFGYPSSIFHSTSLSLAAEQLEEELRDAAKIYDHIIFVTFSAGGLVLKKYLIKIMKTTLQKVQKPSVEDSTINENVFKTRQIINFAVPHSGGAKFPSLGMYLGYVFLLLLLMVLYPFKKLIVGSRKGYHFGLNKIFFQLRHNNQKLLKMEASYRELVEKFDQRHLPRPVSSEINGRRDKVVSSKKYYDKDDAKDITSAHPRYTDSRNNVIITVRGTHPTVKQAKTKHDSIVRYIAQHFTKYEDTEGIRLATTSIKRTFSLDRNAVLIGADKMRLPGYTGSKEP
jgi:hypothetical protein